MGGGSRVRVGLGTAQFGLDYGISNPSGIVPRDEVRRILGRATSAGIRILDTAAAYGGSERLLGDLLEVDHPFSVVTKLPRLPTETAPPAVPDWVRETFDRSLDHLRSARLYGLLVHDARDLLGPAGAEMWSAMDELRERGVVRRIGASVYDAADIDRLLDRYPLELIQVPLNVFDQRLVRSGHLTRLDAAGVEIHARSILLQGLLVMDPERLPRPHFDPVRDALRAFDAAARGAGVSRLEAAVAYVMTIDEVDAAVFGVTDEEQLTEILDAARRSLPTEWFARFARDDDAILNPARWPR
jgi:aryl-alcohol dehydrogenase-like predicted oxidoreductase